MRVLHVIESLEFGGAEKVLVELANSMVGRCDSAVCCVKRGGELQSALDPSVRVHCLNKSEGNHPRLSWELAGLIRGGGYDVVHSHTWAVYVESAVAALMARARVLVHTVHGHYITYPPGLASSAKILVRHRAERLLALAHRKVVTVSDAIQAYVSAEIGIPAARMMTIRNGVKEAALPPRAGSADNAVTFVTVGRLAAVKNHPMLLRAFAEVLRRHPGCRLQIVGDGPERASLEALARTLGIVQHVQFAGFQTDVAPRLAQADVFVLSSHYEGISIALLEAMRAGLPVIGTRVGGMAEAVREGETGLLVPGGDVRAMTDAMCRLAASPAERARMGEHGHAYLLREFSLGAVSQKYFSLYAA